MSIKSAVTKRTLKKVEKITGFQLTFGKLLLAIRKGEGLTQADFSKELGISPQHLCDIEHDRKGVSPKLAANYADQLGYSREQFIRLSLQGIADRDGLDITVEISFRRGKKSKRPLKSAAV